LFENLTEYEVWSQVFLVEDQYENSELMFCLFWQKGDKPANWVFSIQALAIFLLEHQNPSTILVVLLLKLYICANTSWFQLCCDKHHK
jgi:hypothetical protein